MKKLFDRIPSTFSRFYDRLIPTDEIAQTAWERYAPMYTADTKI